MQSHLTPRQETRRQFLAAGGTSLGALALAWLLDQQQASAIPPKPDLHKRRFDLTVKATQHPPKAKAMISLWMQGGPSHIDLFDPKPALNKLAGKPFPGQIKYDNAAQASAKVLPCPWKYKKQGQAGIELSELVPHLAEIIDDVCLIRSMRTGVNNHGQSIRAMNCGRIQGGQPTLGSWLTYGLGADTDELPAYVAMIDPGQLPVLGVENWSNGWLPSLYQGTVVRPTEPRILNLTPPARLKGAAQRRYLSLLQELNREHLNRNAGQLDLEARISTFALAARMQTAAREAIDLSRETAETKKLYGMDEPATADFGARCLIARRLVERGVRFVQVFTQNQFWDHHNAIRRALPSACRKVDKPSAALVKDLKRRGLLDSTVVHWGGEMGRLPVIQNDKGMKNIGRDHNTHGFSMWVAGGGFQKGLAHGSTDEFGHKAIENIVNHYDYQATLLHLFGIDRNKLAFKQNGQLRRFVDDKAKMVKDILA